MWRRMALHLSPLISSSRSSTVNQVHSPNSLIPIHNRCLKQWIGFPTRINAKGGLFPKGKVLFLSFVLGGPGSGKGTQCTKIVKNFGLTHLSAGDLLRREIASNRKIVPSEVTISLIRKEIESSDNHKFLINGFPRSEENRAAFERIIGAEPDIVLSFDCPEEEMVNRVLNHNKVWLSILLINIVKSLKFHGPVDYNIDTVRKRLKVFKALNLPVINYYSRQGKLHMKVLSADQCGGEQLMKFLNKFVQLLLQLR
ncbi:putative UMP-CMP kinase 2 [Citrus sinensis]|uniref:UMP-CMP kinase 2 n=1 Tax=Citrus sinensis TaxID=2711 RepID=A0ACB8HX67_CITSI|nr:putative UMP-CMP kinase 2 [Citrus sinensis]